MWQCYRAHRKKNHGKYRICYYLEIQELNRGIGIQPLKIREK
jgi:hypothetical protein